MLAQQVIRITTLIPRHEMTDEIRCVLCNNCSNDDERRQKEFNYLHEKSLNHSGVKSEKKCELGKLRQLKNNCMT